ncbi:TetR/AcrR family transcriptional regulator [Streptomyces xanthochromogenes]|uniref:Transcriptional regulator, TetR family protein n=1 Tax=Streptomyces xanthochromogenes TaxID=67384 RepID=A0ABQ2ZNC5_9ACTN|nr:MULTISPECIES: TetR/AcrR family transcriptional regulator [Streptomyces]MYV92875.1 TetR family transcriptional regulator [Streptomyces sp. SID1034]GGY19920.1 putative transcriptional regulator, TetR family protein [Streptomyces xanthochromogenes]
MPSDSRGLRPRKQPRQVRAELTRERILDAAAHVFAEYGYAAGTTNRIAERARVSIGSLYQYYPNKDAILVELLTRHLDAGMAGMSLDQDVDQPLPEPIEAVMRRHVRSAIENHRDDPQLLRVMIEQGPRAPELLERVARNELRYIAYTRRLLRNHPDVRVGDVDVAARLVVSTVEMVVHRTMAGPGPIDTARFEDELVSMLTRYLTGGPVAATDN